MPAHQVLTEVEAVGQVNESLLQRGTQLTRSLQFRKGVEKLILDFPEIQGNSQQGSRIQQTAHMRSENRQVGIGVELFQDGFQFGGKGLGENVLVRLKSPDLAALDQMLDPPQTFAAFEVHDFPKEPGIEANCCGRPHRPGNWILQSAENIDDLLIDFCQALEGLPVIGKSVLKDNADNAA